MKKVLMVATVPSMIGQFNMNNIHILLRLGYEVHVGCNFKDRSIWDTHRVIKFEEQLEKLNIKYFQIDFDRNLFQWRNHRAAYLQMKKIFLCNKYSFVHCHTPIASVICRAVAHKTNTKCIYTAHGFHFYTGAPIFNWLFFYPIEKFLSRWTNVLITINQEDYKRAKEKFYAKRKEYVPGVGVDTKRFYSVLIDPEKKRKELSLLNNQIMLLSVGNIDDKKKYETIIRAIKELNDLNIQYFICGNGKAQEYLRKLILDLNMDEQVILLGERIDVPDLCQAADLFIDLSYQERNSFAFMEAVASQTPIISAKTQGNNKFPMEFLFDENSVESVVLVLREIFALKNPLRQTLKECIIENYNNLRTFDFVNELDMGHVLWKRKSIIINLLKKQEFKRELGIDLNGIVLFSVGELNENKNHSIVVKALAELKDTKIHYCIAGIGNLRKEIESLADHLGVGKQVHLLGYRNDIDELLQKVDIYMLPSIREGLNVSLLEAMASGLPCICGDIRGNNDLIENGRGGIRVRSGDVMEWKQAIEKIDYLSHEYGRFNAIKVSGFSMNNVNLQMENIYKGV